MKRQIISIFWVLLYAQLFAQTPTGFSYQAVLRNSNGEVLASQAGHLQVMLTSSNGAVTHYQEVHIISTSAQGIVNVVIGDGLEKVGALADVPWGQDQIHLKLAVKMGSATTFTEMGSQPLQAVPYALHAGNKEVLSNHAAGDDEPIFVVRNRLGQIVFAVYQEGVRVYVDDGTTPTKGTKGGFAVGGLSGIKESVEYFRITPDSARIYIDDSGKGVKGGFAVGGLSGIKTSVDYLRITPDSARVYVKDPGKGAKGGFAVGGLSGIKELPTQFLNLTPENYFIGHEAGKSITSGLYNSFVGYNAGLNNSTGSRNIFVGFNAGLNNSTGVNNVFIGNEAGKNNEGGVFNVFIGHEAGLNNISGNSNVVIGELAGRNITTGIRSVLIGLGAGRDWSASGEGNVFVGYFAGSGTTDPAQVVVSGDKNTSIGYHAGGRLQIGSENVIIGSKAAVEAKKGLRNILIGGNVNYAWDGRSRSADTLVDNVIIGYGAAPKNYYGRRNVIIGAWSNGDQATCPTSGWTTYGNIFIGYGSGFYEKGNNKLYVDNSTTSTPLIYGDFTDGSETLIFNGNVGVGASPGSYKLYVAGNAWTTGTWGGSDLRWKKNILPLENVIKKIAKLKGVKYEWRAEEFPSMNFDKNVHLGFIAQDVELLFPELVSTNKDGFKSVAYDKVSALLVEAIKEQQKEIELLRAELDSIKAMLKK